MYINCVESQLALIQHLAVNLFLSHRRRNDLYSVKNNLFHFRRRRDLARSCTMSLRSKQLLCLSWTQLDNIQSRVLYKSHLKLANTNQKFITLLTLYTDFYWLTSTIELNRQKRLLFYRNYCIRLSTLHWRTVVDSSGFKHSNVVRISSFFRNFHSQLCLMVF